MAGVATAFIQDLYLFEKLLLTTYSAFTNTLTTQQIARITSQRVCLLPLGVEGITRKVRPLCVDLPITPTQKPVTFDYRSPTVVGGAAIQALNACVQANSYMPPFPTQTYPTSDIDIVWWPEIQLPADIQTVLREKGTPYTDAEGGIAFSDWADTSVFFQEGARYAVVSSSPYMATFVGVFNNKLERFMSVLFREETTAITALLSRLMGTTNIQHTHVTTEVRHVAPAGVYSVSVLLSVNREAPFKLVDISLHDGASSQMATLLEPVNTDPIYMDYRTSLMMPYPSMDVPIPNLQALIRQTVFANNRILNTYERTGRQDLQMKVFAFHARVQYMYDLLMYMWTQKTWESYTLRTLLNVLTPDVGFVQYFQNSLFQSGAWIATCHTSLADCGVQNRDMVQALCAANRMLKKTLCEESISTQSPRAPLLWAIDPREFGAVPTLMQAGTVLPPPSPLPLPTQPLYLMPTSSVLYSPAHYMPSQQTPLPPTSSMTYSSSSYYEGPSFGSRHPMQSVGSEHRRTEFGSRQSKRPKQNTYKSGPRYRHRRMTRRRR